MNLDAPTPVHYETTPGRWWKDPESGRIDRVKAGLPLDMWESVIERGIRHEVVVMTPAELAAIKADALREAALAIGASSRSLPGMTVTDAVRYLLRSTESED